MRLQTRWARVDFDSTRRQRVCNFPGPTSAAYSGNRRTESEMHPWNAHRAWVVLLGAATALAVTASLATAAPGAAPRIVRVRAVLAAGNERPGQEVKWPTARGVFIATIDRLKSTMSWRLTYSGMSGRVKLALLQAGSTRTVPTNPSSLLQLCGDLELVGV